MEERVTEISMIERVARVLADGGHMGVTLAFIEQQDTDAGSIPLLRQADTAKAISAARAAIEAMREPTDAMANVAYSGVFCIGDGMVTNEDAAALWRDMIDAALPASPVE